MLKSNTLNIIGDAKDLLYITFPNLNTKHSVAAFTTRMGGVSRGRFASMNMSFLNGDDATAVKQNYDILFDALSLDSNTAVLSHQTHTSNLRIVTEEDAGKGITKSRDYTDIDGLITNCKNIPLVTQFADCVPLLFYDPVKQIVAAAHAGWRGTVAEIGKKTVKKMCEAFGCDAKNIKAAIGPSIGKCCYEVDDPVVISFKQIKYINQADILTPKENGKYMLDLQTANRIILENAGVPFENICISDLCTCCNSQYFHSHRATGGSRGNLAAVIALK